MATYKDTVNLPANTWTNVGLAVAGAFTLQNRARAGSDVDPIEVNTGATSGAAVTGAGAYHVEPGEAMENKKITDLWPGSTDTYLFMNPGNYPGKVTLAHA